MQESILTIYTDKKRQKVKVFRKVFLIFRQKNDRHKCQPFTIPTFQALNVRFSVKIFAKNFEPAQKQAPMSGWMDIEKAPDRCQSGAIKWFIPEKKSKSPAPADFRNLSTERNILIAEVAMCGHGTLIPTGYMPAGAQEKSFGAAMWATGIVGAFLEGSPHCGGKALFATVGAVFQRKRPCVFPCAAVYLIKSNSNSLPTSLLTSIDWSSNITS